MPLIADVQRVLIELWSAAHSDWREIFRPHGWDFTADQLSTMSQAGLMDALVNRSLNVDRQKPGFEDFAPQGNRMISPGKPGESLLYHALASPGVHPTADGRSSANPLAYPSLADLDVVENFIYNLVADRADLAGTFVAVFAYQYRRGTRSPHRRHADMAYSRTGVARVGTAPANYERARRSFWVVPEEGGEKIAVMPARYAAFLARLSKPGAAGSVQGGHNGANDDFFVFPVHKLFDGTECLANQTLKVKFAEFHRNEKLRKTHALSPTEGGLPLPPGFSALDAPFVRDSKNGGSLVTLQREGASVLVVPVHGDTLVQTASQRNTLTDHQQIVYFTVPKKTTIRNRNTRFTESTLEIPAFDSDRLGPEYVNIRHEVDPNGPPDQRPTDLNSLPRAEFETRMKDGGYAAAHFIDSSSDGCVEAIVEGTASSPEDRPAFSLVTAPDFFPLADQVELDQDQTVSNVEPLSKGRLPANPMLPLPSAPAVDAFHHREKTITAVVGKPAVGPRLPILGQPNEMTSYLPDAASNVFAPGWDTSRSRDALGAYLTSSGLGSPFPEDAKLCAALSSFWPAVAPDASRTFGNDRFPNQLPMLDEELGFHPSHERVKNGEVISYRGWDGEFGPFFETTSGKPHVNYASIERSDYVTHALENRIRVSLTATVQSEDLLARKQALRQCENLFARDAGIRADCLVVVRKIDDWTVADRGVPQLAGGGFLFEFAKLDAAVKATNDLTRKRRLVLELYTCQIGENGIAFRRGSQAFTFFSFS